MPLRPSLSRPKNNRMRIYDRVTYGDLAEFSLLDGRQYRSRAACYIPPDGGGWRLENDESCPELRDRTRSMLGMPQEAWLYKGLQNSKARWNVIAQNMMMADFAEEQRGGDLKFSTDDWNGYPENRARLLRHIEKTRVANPVVLTGDMHSFWTNDLRMDFRKSDTPVLATEFVTSSITSGCPQDHYEKHLHNNPQVRFFESRKRGYASVDLTPERMTTRFQAISDARDPNASLATLETFVIENGRAGAIGA
jgi:alkaline phosphatase D